MVGSPVPDSKTLLRHALVATLLSILPGLSLASNVNVGEPPPDNIGASTDGERIRVSDDTGKLQIVSFWATWCAPCRKELPVLNAIQKQVGADRMRVIAVNLEEPRAQFRRAMRAYKDFEITFVHDKKGITARRYGVKGIPFLVIIDVDGTVAYTHTGYGEATLPKIVDEINELLIRNQLAGANPLQEQPGDAQAAGH